MEDLDQLEKRLNECRKVMGNVLDNMNYIQRQIESIKASQNIRDKQNQSNAQGQPQNGQQTSPQQGRPQQGSQQWQAQSGQSQQGAQQQWQHGQPQGWQAQSGIQQPGQQSPQQPGPQQQWQQIRQQGQQQQGRQPQQGWQPQGNPQPGSQQPGPQSWQQGMPQQCRQQPGQQQWQQNRQQAQWQAYNGRPSAAKNTVQTDQKDASNIESIFGKNIMAVAASVLIFISLILFAALIIPNMTNEIKFTFMMVASLGITAFGLIKWFDKKESTLFLSVGACGVGAVYLSLILGHLYFKLIGGILLFILLLIWSAGVLYLSKLKKILFEIIGCSGIVIAVNIGVFMGRGADSEISFMVIVLYFIIGILSFMIFGGKDRAIYLITNISAVICMLLLALDGAVFAGYNALSPDSEKLTDESMIPAYIILGIFCIGMIVYNMIRTDEKNRDWMGFFGMGYFLFLLVQIDLIINDTEIYLICECAVCLLMIVACEWYVRTKKSAIRGIGTYCWISTAVLLLIWYVFRSNWPAKMPIITGLSILFVIYGFVKNYMYAKILGISVYGIAVLIFITDPIEFIICTVVVFAVMNIYMYIKNEQYNSVIKCLSYSTFLIGIIKALVLMAVNEWISDETSVTVIIMIIGFINILAMKSIYRKNWEINEDDKVSLTTSYVVNALVMVISLPIMCSAESELNHWLLVLTAIALFMANSLNLLKKGGVLETVYLGLKSTVLLITILISFKATGNVLSIAVFILSIILIAIGFKVNEKGLRIYGLVISLVCVVKLVMIDIIYENTIGHAISFFVSGVLCFAISAIYGYAEKKLKDIRRENGKEG
ncbi:MAG: DUF2339 domain-containing protein [Lachnospiraceae bacterium]|nr:DUF2339 domain-containing protein [Lachnospiraceae bacterium]